MDIYNWSNKTVLIAEDNSGNSLLLNEILSSTGIQIINTTNGMDALTECRKNKSINLVLMDIKMPIMDGYKAFEEIKKFRSDLPIIAQTAYAYNEDIAKAKEIGFNEYLIKPLKVNTVLETLDKYLNN